ncbi:MAG: aspartate-semialdehyde dehydrogenase [Bacillota bacterium]
MSYNIAIVGTGAVGGTILEVLEQRNFPIKNLKLLATKRSAGKKIKFKNEDIIIEETTNKSFKGVDIALFAGGSASLEYARIAVANGTVVIDNGSAFRLDTDVPLVVPEVNPEDLHWHKGLIANPNCSTIQMVVALKPIYDAVGIKRVIVSTYQAVSGAGQEAMDELISQTKDLLNGISLNPVSFPHPIAFNLIPHIDKFMENDYTREEMKMVNETRKIMHDDELKISATAVRVPVLRSHSEAITVETMKPIDTQSAKECFQSAKGIVVVDDIANNQYPMPIISSYTDEVYVGRIRKDLAFTNGITFWVVADQLRKGAATNAIQIAEILIQRNLI